MATPPLLEEKEDVGNMWPRTLNRAQSFLTTPHPVHTRVSSLLREGPRPLNRGYQTPDERPLHRHAAYERMAMEEPASSVSSSASLLEAKETLRQLAFKAPPKLEAVPEMPCGTSTPAEAIVNCANILMGSGLLALPYAAKAAGGYLGICALLTVASAGTLFTGKILGKELERRGARGFPDLAFYAFGKKGRVVVAVALYFDIFMCLVLFLIMGAANLAAFFDGLRLQDGSLLDSCLGALGSPAGCVWLLAVLLVPATALDDLTALAKFSAVGTVATVLLVAVVTISALFARNRVREHDRDRGIDRTLNDSQHEPLSKALALGLVLFCFAGHALFPSIYYSLQDPKNQWDRVIDTAYAIVLGSSAVVACAGYSLFGDQVSDQISVDIGAVDRTTGAVCCFLIAVSAASKFALELQPLALGVEELLDDDDTKVDSNRRSRFVSLLRAYRPVVLRASLLGLALVCAILIPAFSVVDSLLGAIFATFISFLFPCAVALVGNTTASFAFKATCYVTIVLSATVGVLGTWGSWAEATGKI